MTVVDNLGGPVPTTAGMPDAAPLATRCLARGARLPGRLLRSGRAAGRAVVSAGALPQRRAGASWPSSGARAASAAGCERARDWPRRSGRQGFAVVSGGAFGIDAAAHEGALDAGAATYAVLGCGVDVVYPDRHGLFDGSPPRGGLLSEYPPGTPPRPGQFPARNRLIAALAEAVIVVEAAGARAP